MDLEKLTDPDYLRQHIEQRITDELTRALQKEDARIIYGTNAVKQPPSRHVLRRRAKRRGKHR